MGHRERNRRYYERHKSDPEFQKRLRAKRNRWRFGFEHLGDFCELCFRSGSEVRLIGHHKFYKSCDDCKSDGHGGYCSRPGHVETLCRSCHYRLHAQDIDYKALNDHKHNMNHLNEIKNNDIA